MNAEKKVTRKLSFGKVDYLKRGKKNCPVTVELTLTDTENGPAFTACGEIWNHTRTDVYAGGQCLDTIAKYVHNARFNEILRLWRSYHLNDMHPECEHQRALGWCEEAHEEISSYAFSLKDEVDKKIRDAKRRAVDCIKTGETFTPTEEETRLSLLPDRITTATDEAPEYYKYDTFFYPTRTHEKKEMRGWVRYEEDPRGLLGKPCPVCGYGYGTAWKHAPIPEDDLLKIREIMGLNENGTTETI